MCAIAALGGCAQAQSWSVGSPSGLLRLTVRMADLGGQADFAKGPRLYYRVEQGEDAKRQALIGDSPLGLKLADRDFVDDLRFVSASAVRTVEENYVMPHGKRRQCHNRGNELTLALANAAGQVLEIDLRAYDDGVAFRYRLPKAPGVGGAGEGAGSLRLESEATGFAVPAGAKLWMAPSDKATTYSPAYETYYENSIGPGTASPTGMGWSFPVLFTTGDAWALITEANLSAGFCGTRLASSAPAGVYRIDLPSAEEGNGTGARTPSSTLPWEMPWRVIIVGNSPGGIVESTLVDDVSDPSRLKDTSWIKPGRVAWSWWSDNPSPKDAGKQMKFVDLAAEMGWEYVLVDANWDIMDNGNIHDVLRYAQKKGVGVLLWYNSGGPHNVVTEKPRDTLTYAPVRRFELDMLRNWGVKGIKVDFFQSDKQNVIELYQGILADAAERKIMVNFHGCTLPRGWCRTWPHLMSMEGVRGEECYIFDPKYPQQAPVQNTILPFARNAVGPMDYTPVAFSDNRYPHLTSYAHELALSVVFESGWLHFADKPEAYLTLPPAPKEFLKHVPVVWDDTRFVAGYPGRFVILARRSGESWYFAGINGQDEALEQRIPCSGAGELTIISDGADGRSFAVQSQRIDRGEEFRVKMLPRGGFVATLKPGR